MSSLKRLFLLVTSLALGTSLMFNNVQASAENCATKILEPMTFRATDISEDGKFLAVLYGMRPSDLPQIDIVDLDSLTTIKRMTRDYYVSNLAMEMLVNIRDIQWAADGQLLILTRAAILSLDPKSSSVVELAMCPFCNSFSLLGKDKIVVSRNEGKHFFDTLEVADWPAKTLNFHVLVKKAMPASVVRASPDGRFIAYSTTTNQDAVIDQNGKLIVKLESNSHGQQWQTENELLTMVRNSYKVNMLNIRTLKRTPYANLVNEMERDIASKLVGLKGFSTNNNSEYFLASPRGGVVDLSLVKKSCVT